MAPDRDSEKKHAEDLVLGNGDLVQSGSEPNAMRSQSGAGNVSGSGSSETCSFQFFTHSEDGLNLSVDLNSDPLDWMRVCSNGLRVPQHIHRPKPVALRSEEGSTRGVAGAVFLNADRALQGGFCNRSVSEKVGSSGIDEPSAVCMGKEVQTELQGMPERPEATGELCAAQLEASQISAVNDGKELGGRGVEQHSVTGSESEPKDAGMIDQGVLSGSGQEPGDHQCILPHEHAVSGADREPRGLEMTDQDVLSGFGHVVPSIDREPRDVGMTDRGVLSDSGQESADHHVQAHEDVQNKDGKNTRNLLLVDSVENPREEMNCTDSMIKKFQDKSQRHVLKVKLPNVKNLRFLKTLVRGPVGAVILQDRYRRKSARFTAKSREIVGTS